MSRRRSWCLPLVLLLLGWLAAAAQAQDSEPCPHREMWELSPERLQAILQDHQKWLEAGRKPSGPGRRAVFCKADLSEANLRYANLQKANLMLANLQKANLEAADLSEADLTLAYLREADLRSANLQKANLEAADLSEADLTLAYLREADLRSANLQKADLTLAYLPEADLRNTDLEGARLSGAGLYGVRYEPVTAPAPGYLTGVWGLATLRFGAGANSGAVLLRTKLAEVGLRDLEREVTYAIEHNTTRNLLFRELFVIEEDQTKEEVRWDEPLRLIEAGFRWVFFEAPVAYGLHPGRALQILLAAIGGFALIYLVPLSKSGADGIHRIWPKGRLGPKWPQIGWEEEIRVERLQPRGGWRRLGTALQFSIITAFHLGWRDLNVGTWLSRLQTKEYALQATGWVRVVAGIQSLLSVYLLALWALTYFGRPFG
jgi:hypothetical protein